MTSIINSLLNLKNELKITKNIFIAFPFLMNLLHPLTFPESFPVVSSLKWSFPISFEKLNINYSIEIDERYQNIQYMVQLLIVAVCYKLVVYLVL